MRRSIAYFSIALAALPFAANAQMAIEPLPPVPVAEPLYPDQTAPRARVAAVVPVRRYVPVAPVAPVPVPVPISPQPVAQPTAPAGAATAGLVRSFRQPVPVIAVGQAFVLPGNTSIVLRLESSLSSRETRRGEAVRLKVARDVVLGGYVVVPKGTSAVGEVIRKGNSGGFGKGGTIEIEARSLMLNGRAVALSGSLLEKGSGAKVGKLLLFGALSGAMGLAQVRGDDAVVGTDTMLAATTREDVAFN